MSDGHDTGATVRAWTDVIRRSQFDKIVPGTHPGRFVKSSTVKAVALMLASYADANGRRVFPGIARLAADCEVGYNVASRVVVGLRDLGLIERTRLAVRRGARSEREKTDEYRLTLPEDLLERLTVPTPSDYRVIVARVAKPHRPQVLSPPKEGSDRPDPSAPYARSDPAAGSESDCASDTTPDVSEYAFGTDLSAPQCAAKVSLDLATTDTSHSGEDLRTDVTVPRARKAEPEDPNFGEDEGGPPTLRIVTGGGHTTPTVPGLWPAAVPALEPLAATATVASPTVAQQAIDHMRRNLAAKRGRRTA